MAEPEAATERQYTRLLSDEETRARLGGIPQVRLDRWRREGRIEHVRLTNKTVACTEEGVEAFIRANLIEPTHEPTPGAHKPKSEAHRKRISEAQKAAWARRKAGKS